MVKPEPLLSSASGRSLCWASLHVYAGCHQAMAQVRGWLYRGTTAEKYVQGARAGCWPVRNPELTFDTEPVRPVTAGASAPPVAAPMALLPTIANLSTAVLRWWASRGP